MSRADRRFQLQLNGKDITSGGQVREKIQKWLSPRPINKPQTAREVHHKGPPRGPLKKSSIMNGRREARSCGPTGRMIFLTFTTATADGSSIIEDAESICASRLTSATYYYFDFKDTEKARSSGHSLLSFHPALHSVLPWLRHPIKLV